MVGYLDMPARAGAAPECETPTLVNRVRAARLQAGEARRQASRTLARVAKTTVRVASTRQRAAQAREQGHEHADRDLTVADIAAASFVTSRALQLAFRRQLDMTAAYYHHAFGVLPSHTLRGARDPAGEV